MAQKQQTSLRDIIVLGLIAVMMVMTVKGPRQEPDTLVHRGSTTRTNDHHRHHHHDSTVHCKSKKENTSPSRLRMMQSLETAPIGALGPKGTDREHFIYYDSLYFLAMQYGRQASIEFVLLLTKSYTEIRRKIIPIRSTLWRRTFWSFRFPKNMILLSAVKW